MNLDLAILDQDFLSLAEGEELFWIVVVHLQVYSRIKTLQSNCDFNLPLVATAEHVGARVSHDLCAVSLQILLGHLRDLLLLLMLLVKLLLMVSFIVTDS